jgi:hypothetical protein
VRAGGGWHSILNDDLGCESFFNLSEQIGFTLHERPDAGRLFSMALNGNG